jgi:hypothetical protein
MFSITIKLFSQDNKEGAIKTKLGFMLHFYKSNIDLKKFQEKISQQQLYYDGRIMMSNCLKIF